MRNTHRLILTVVGVTLVSVIVSLAAAELVGFAIGVVPDWRHYVLSLLVPAVVTPVWALPLVRANHQLAQMHVKMQRLAHVDSLSGLPNRRAFFDRAQAIFSTADENGLPAAIMMVDVDSFKDINDTYGHDIGDAVIRAIAGTLRRIVIENVGEDRSVVARIGGEEFAVVVSRLSETRAGLLAEEICRSVRELTSSRHDLCLTVTVSVGVAARGPGESIDAVLKFADNAVYAAKRAGRNQWRFAAGGRAPARQAHPAVHAVDAPSIVGDAPLVSPPRVVNG